MNSARLKSQICAFLDEMSDLIIGLSQKIHSNPELSFHEYNAVKSISERMKKAGFKIKQNIGGLKTASRAIHTAQSTGPTIVFLAEYDALPQLGHACGHNIIAGMAVGATLAVGTLKDRLSGTLQLIGCPAEEKEGGKIIMVKKKVSKNGGLSKTKKIAVLAETYGLTCLINCELEFGITQTASLHLGCTLPNLADIGHAYMSPLRLADDVTDYARFVDRGWIRVPESPGLGVSLNHN